ncbi:hypothetical protein FRC09_017971 [Ceratobasidium sp. 395]|nr:hypothetical protein FRC09_017971 [Ceratobasidium sp. 395]
MAALRRQAPHPRQNPDTPSAGHSTPSRNTTPIPPSTTLTPSHTSIVEESIIDTLRAATAPYRLDESPADFGLPLDLDTIMANVGLANNTDEYAPAATPPTNDSLDDPTLPQLPPSMYGVELLPEAPLADTEGHASVAYSPRSDYSELADISDLEDESEVFDSDIDIAHVERQASVMEDIADPPLCTGSETPLNPPHIPLDSSQQERPSIPTPSIPPHIRFYESLALDLHGRFGLTRTGVEYMLKSIDWSVGDAGVVEPRLKNTSESTSPELSKTLPALLKRAQIESFGDKYAVCPNMECNRIVLVSTLPRDVQSHCEECSTSLMKLRRQRIGTSPRYVPKLTFTYHSLITQLEQLLSRPEIIAAIRSHKAHLNRPGRDRDTKEDIQHGRVWSEMKGPDGKLFFTPDGDEIGLILALDWWKPENVILIGTIPGPAETKTDQLANFLDPLVEELLTLWNAPRTTLPTESGERVRLIKGALVICICDAPAARKLSGTQGVTGTYFCTRCWCHKDELDDLEKVHDARTIAEHRKAAATYQTLHTDTERTEFMKTRTYFSTSGGYRYVALLKLPYWDGARMVVVDPMHCMFLGIVKWQLKNIWAKYLHMREGDGFEIDMLHDIVQSAQLPDFLGRPPPHTGTKQGGSLTADQLRTLISVVFPIAIPVIWDTIDQASADQRALEEYRRQKAEHARLVAEREVMKRVMGANAPALPPLPNAPRAPRRPRKGKKKQAARTGQHSYPDDEYLLEEDESDPEILVHTSFRRADDASIIDLALAVQNLTRRNVTTEQQENGRMHLRRYLATFAKARGLENMAPNHHLSTHIPDQVSDYGPGPQTWAFGSERLNRELKNTRTNRHTGGTVEDTYANTFFRRQALSTQIRSIAQSNLDPLRPWAQLSMQRDEECRGTAASTRLGSETISSKRQSLRRLHEEEHAQVTRHLQQMFPHLDLRLSVRTIGKGEIVDELKTIYAYARVQGRVFRPNSSNGIVLARVAWGDEPDAHRVGEIVEIFSHTHGDGELSTTVLFAKIRWYIDTAEGFSQRAVRLWQYDA